MATTACKKGQVKVNETAVKPSREVFIGDLVSLRKNQITYQIKVIAIPANRVGAKLVDLYRIDTTPVEAFQAQELLKLAKDYYRKKGTGRPTKKDRRDLDDYYQNTEN